MRPVLVVVVEFSNFKERVFLSLIPKCVILWWAGNEPKKKSTVLSLHWVKNLDFLQIAPSEPEPLKPKWISRQLWQCHAINNPLHKASDYPHMKHWSWGSSGAQYSTSREGLRGIIIVSQNVPMWVATRGPFSHFNICLVFFSSGCTLSLDRAGQAVSPYFFMLSYANQLLVCKMCMYVGIMNNCIFLI